jgi:beta-glucosidase
MNIEKIMQEMTIEEKAKLLSGRKLWFFNGVPRLGIRDFIVSDGPHGIRAYQDFNDNNGHPRKKEPATAFPSASCMASTWNEELLFSIGETIAKECNHYQVDIVLGPGVNGKRSPLGGRNFEYYSEDPYLTARMGIGFVKGVQSQGVGTSLKHFILNEQETSRRFISSDVDERTFRELYALPFEMIVKEAKPLTVMAAYNRVNGIYACENPETLTNLLRNEWGYKGITISDWGGIQNKRASVLAGLDIEMPESEFVLPFIETVKAGQYPFEMIDSAVERILKTYQWMLANPNRGKIADFEANHLIAQRVAEEGIVLLKNAHSILPLSKHRPVVVLGSYAQSPRTHGGGSSELRAYKTEVPLDEISRFAPTLFFPDYTLNETSEAAIREAKTIILFTGTTVELEHEGDDRINMRLPQEQMDFIKQVCELNKNVVVVNNSGSAIEVTDFIDDIQALLQCWFLGSASGVPIAKILFGDINPSGRLSETFPIKIEHTSTYPIFPGKSDKTDYTEGLFTGYRHFDTHQIQVAFPFGFGLSYTTFETTNLLVSSRVITQNDTLKISIDVKNTGLMSGKQTLQLYLRSLNSRLSNPDKILKGFVKAEITPGNVKTFEWSLTSEAFAKYFPEKHQFMVESGHYQILIGTSVNEIIAEDTIFFESKDDTTIHLSIDHPVRSWVETPKYYEIIKSLLAENREIHFYEYEEPLKRIIRRILNEKHLDSSNIEQTIVDIQNQIK